MANTCVVTFDVFEAILQELLHRWHCEVSAILQLHEKWNRESTEEFNSTVFVERLGIAIIEIRTDGFPVVQENTLLFVKILDDADRIVCSEDVLDDGFYKGTLIDGAVFGFCIRHFDFSKPRRIVRLIEVIDVLDGPFNFSLFDGAENPLWKARQILNV